MSYSGTSLPPTNSELSKKHFGMLMRQRYCCSRAGVAQYMKTEWRVVAIFNVILFVILVKPTRHTYLAGTCSFSAPCFFIYVQLCCG